MNQPKYEEENLITESEFKEHLDTQLWKPVRFTQISLQPVPINEIMESEYVTQWPGEEL